MINPADFFLWYAAFLFSLVCHEASHSVAALYLGDSTAYQGGQASLDPIPHIRREPFGTVVIPVLSFFMGGWMIGWASAPYNGEWARMYPRRSAWMAAAGPASNLVLVLICAILIHIGIAMSLLSAPDVVTFSRVVVAPGSEVMASMAKFISILFSLNLVLFLFNLIPLPPLDGSSVLALFLSPESAGRYLDVITNPGFNIIGIFLAWELFDQIYSPFHQLCILLLYPGYNYG